MNEILKNVMFGLLIGLAVVALLYSAKQMFSKNELCMHEKLTCAVFVDDVQYATHPSCGFQEANNMRLYYVNAFKQNRTDIVCR